MLDVLAVLGFLGVGLLGWALILSGFIAAAAVGAAILLLDAWALRRWLGCGL